MNGVESSRRTLLAMLLIAMLLTSTNLSISANADAGPDEKEGNEGTEEEEKPDNSTNNSVEPIPRTPPAPCMDGTIVSKQYYSSNETLWVQLGFNENFSESGDPAYASQNHPLQISAIPPSSSNDWNESRIQLGTSYISNSATEYSYETTLGSTSAPAGSQYIWTDTDPANPQWLNGPLTSDNDFNSHIGFYVFRHDFTVPSDAYDFEFAAIGYADNYFMKDPYIASSDFSIRTTSQLETPAVDLYPSPSDTHPIGTLVSGTTSYGGHIGDVVSTNPIQYAYGTHHSFSQDTDLSFVTFVDNNRYMGVLAFSLSIKYCQPTPPPSDPIELPETGEESEACGPGYDGGVLSVSSGANTGYRMYTGTPQTHWFATEPVLGTYTTGGGDIWANQPDWTTGSPIFIHQPIPNAGGGTYQISNQQSLPVSADDSEWIWNGDYIKEYGIHEFGQLVSLSSLNIPQGNVVTELDAVVYFSADSNLAWVSTSDSTQSQQYGIMHTDFNTINGIQSSTHTRYIHRTGEIANGYTVNDVLRPIIDPSTNRPPNDDVMFKITAQDSENPQFAGTGLIENVDPAGLRFAILLCATWDLPVSTPPPSAEKCPGEEIELYSGQNQTEIRALQRDNSGYTTWVMPSSTASGAVIPGYYQPEPWQDMEILDYSYDSSATVPTGQYTLPNEYFYVGGGGGFYQTMNPNCNSLFPSDNCWNSNGNGIVPANQNMFQPHNPSAEWMMYGHPNVPESFDSSTASIRVPGDFNAHLAPKGLKEVRIPFTIPADAEYNSVEITGSIGLAPDVVNSIPGLGYVYPACLGTQGTGATPIIPCHENTLFPDFTPGVSIVSQQQPSIPLESISADSGVYIQVDARGNGLQISFDAVQMPGDYYLKFYLAVDVFWEDGFYDPYASASSIVAYTSPDAQQNRITEYPNGVKVVEISLKPFAMKWSFDVEYDVCPAAVIGGGGGTGGGGSLPFLSPTTVILLLSFAVYNYGRKNDFDIDEIDSKES